MPNPHLFPYPQQKLTKLWKVHKETKYEWAYKGCLELIACRNVVAHAGGKWNQKSVAIVASFVSPPPAPGAQLVIGFEMLFQFRKAIRTFLSRIEVNAGLIPAPPPKAPKPPRKSEPLR